MSIRSMMSTTGGKAQGKDANKERTPEWFWDNPWNGYFWD